jgi:hypothetical protein
MRWWPSISTSSIRSSPTIVAAAHGSVTEKRSLDGKDTSGEFVWMDLFEKRGGKWVIVRSAGARVK